MSGENQVRCEGCGREFGCGMAGGAADPAECWCFRVPYQVAMPEPGAAAGCLCPECLEAAARAEAPRGPDGT